MNSLRRVVSKYNQSIPMIRSYAKAKQPVHQMVGNQKGVESIKKEEQAQLKAEKEQHQNDSKEGDKKEYRPTSTDPNASPMNTAGGAFRPDVDAQTSSIRPEEHYRDK